MGKWVEFDTDKIKNVFDEKEGIYTTSIIDSTGLTFSGTVKAVDGDVFSEQKGRRLSYLKAKRKMMSYYRRASNQEVIRLRKLLNIEEQRRKFFHSKEKKAMFEFANAANYDLTTRQYRD